MNWYAANVFADVSYSGLWYRHEYWYCIGALNCASNVALSANWVYVQANFRPHTGAESFGASYVATYQTGSNVTIAQQYVSLGWRWTKSTGGSIVSFVFNSGYYSELIVQRIG
jgi:hypothetical protein